MRSGSVSETISVSSTNPALLLQNRQNLIINGIAQLTAFPDLLGNSTTLVSMGSIRQEQLKSGSLGMALCPQKCRDNSSGNSPRAYLRMLTQDSFDKHL